jgi:hypothetical protein
VLTGLTCQLSPGGSGSGLAASPAARPVMPVLARQGSLCHGALSAEAVQDVPWPTSGHDRDELDRDLGKAVFGAVTTGGVRRVNRPSATSRRRRSARMFEAIPLV